jgi:P4 family phage/plasmid primase-like protien
MSAPASEPAGVPSDSALPLLDFTAARDFLERRFGHETYGHAIFMFAPAAGGRPIHRGVELDKANRWVLAERHLRKYAETHDCYVGVANYAIAPTAKMQRKKEMVGHLDALICERDAAAIAPQLPPASLTVETSDGRFQDYWLLDQPTDVPTFEGYTRRIARACGIGFEAVDAARVLRVPGTRNHKPARRGEIVRLIPGSDRRYPLADFDHLPAISAPAAATTTAALDDGERVPAARIVEWARARAATKSRNETGFMLAGQLRDNGYSESDAEAIGLADYVPRVPATTPDGVIEPYTAEEYRASVRQAYTQPARDPWPAAPGKRTAANSAPENAAGVFTTGAGAGNPPIGAGEGTAAARFRSRMHTDYGNAERLIDQHGPDLHYIVERGMWVTWDDTRWAIDETGEVVRRAKRTVRNIYREAQAAEDGAKSAELGKHGAKSEAAARLAAMIDLARSEPGVSLHLADFDGDPWLLNCKNGVIDLRAGALRPHDRAELHMKRVPVAYDPDATCPTWLAFLARIMAGNDRLITFLQRAIGYSFTGMTREQVFFVLHGQGSNGKSTLLETLAALLDDYAQPATIATFLRKEHDDAVRDDVADMVGARFISAVEPGDGARLDESLIKEVTGESRMKVRFLYKNYFYFTPEFKLWLSVNHRPTIRGTDHAIWRRPLLIPFTVIIPDEEQDKDLKRKLLAELPGILAWAVRGCFDWQRDGLAIPEEVRAATSAYRAEMDILAGFIADRCIEHRNASVTAGMLYKEYQRWCDETGERQETQTTFGKRLTERGFVQKRDRKGQRSWSGIGLRTDEIQESLSPNLDAFDAFDTISRETP